MGLGINYARLDDVLLQLYMDEDHIAERAAQAKSAIKQAIDEQTGVESSFPNEPSPPSDLDASYLGSYSAVHLLRMFAARTAGFTLDEAYELEVDNVAPSVTSVNRESLDPVSDEPHDEIPEDQGGLVEGSSEADFRIFYGVEIDTVLPVPPEKVTPFPYYNLVCFSDTEGIYVPVWFPRPIEVDGYFYVGSLMRLQEELVQLKAAIDAAIDAKGPPDSPKARYLRTVLELWRTLHESCAKAVEYSISLVFE